jgi:hypothetical protein
MINNNENSVLWLLGVFYSIAIRSKKGQVFWLNLDLASFA